MKISDCFTKKIKIKYLQTKFHDGRSGRRRGSSVRCSCRRPSIRHGGGLVLLEHEARLDDLLLLHARHLHGRHL